VPFTNWTLYLAVIALVVGFQNSSNLAAAYGIAVTGTMLIDTILSASSWSCSGAGTSGSRSSWPARCFCVDIAFFSANIIKVPEGGWFPIAMASCPSRAHHLAPRAQAGARRNGQADHSDGDFINDRRRASRHGTAVS
jgi:K+ transporter